MLAFFFSLRTKSFSIYLASDSVDKLLLFAALGGELSLWGLFWERKMGSSLKRAEESEREREVLTPTRIATNLTDTEAASSTAPSQHQIPTGFGTYGRIEIEHEEDPSVPLPVGPDILPGFAVSAEAREGNDCSNEP